MLDKQHFWKIKCFFSDVFYLSDIICRENDLWGPISDNSFVVNGKILNETVAFLTNTLVIICTLKMTKLYQDAKTVLINFVMS